MKIRKTIEIQFIKDKVNLSLSSSLNTEQKEILCTFLEIILLEKNLYQGYMFLDNSKSETLSNGYFSRKYF
jgi:hypothetical protein